MAIDPDTERRRCINAPEHENRDITRGEVIAAAIIYGGALLLAIWIIISG